MLLQVKAEDAIVGSIVLVGGGGVLLPCGFVVESLEGPVLVGSLEEGGVQGLEAVVVLMVPLGGSRGRRLGGYDAPGVVLVVLTLLFPRPHLPRGEDGGDEPFGVTSGVTARRRRSGREKTTPLPLVLQPAEELVVLAPLLLLQLPLVTIAHAVDQAVEHGLVGPLGRGGILSELKFGLGPGDVTGGKGDGHRGR